MSWHACYVVSGGALGIGQGGANHVTAFGAICRGGVREGTVPLVQLSAFQLLSPLPTSKLGPSSSHSQVGGFVYILGPCGSLQ